MATLDLTQPTRSGGSTNSEDRPILPNDNYRMRIIESKIEDDMFDKDKDGTPRKKLVLTFEMNELTPAQQRAPPRRPIRTGARSACGTASTRCILCWSRLAGRASSKSSFDNLAEWKLLDLNLAAFNTDPLVGIELMCMVVRHTKTMATTPASRATRSSASRQLRPRIASRSNRVGSAAGRTQPAHCPSSLEHRWHHSQQSPISSGAAGAQPVGCVAVRGAQGRRKAD